LQHHESVAIRTIFQLLLALIVHLIANDPVIADTVPVCDGVLTVELSRMLAVVAAGVFSGTGRLLSFCFKRKELFQGCS